MSFQNCRLGESSLKEIKDFISDKNINFNPAWFSIIGKPLYQKNESHQDKLHLENGHNLITSDDDDVNNENQFFFTQAENVVHLEKTSINLPVEDLIKCSIESLEHSNGRLNFLHLKALSDEDLSKVFGAFKEHLSENGVFNLCYSVCSMTIEQSQTFLPALSIHFLLPKITELENDSVLIKKGICDWALKFPNELRQLVLTEILNSEPKSINTIVALLKIFANQKDTSFLLEFADRTRELKQWHIFILNMFPVVRLEGCSRNKLLKLFIRKSNTFSDNKDYAKLIHSFAKTNAPFTEEERSMLAEIATLNRTIYKNLISKYSNSC
ncbi:uncharacterized protein LOC122504450 [Leptopilina heterotoma]|uniref:uncharacterized protein LOC122504450 n=1 Tax=Leptopilina heterotoma TaxID=63436 RepID=UPI001CA96900|nr:uncharacterized protein LOC122504450 [Leptopilina heterotoma]